jgi:hypothetical protein
MRIRTFDLRVFTTRPWLMIGELVAALPATFGRRGRVAIGFHRLSFSMREAEVRLYEDRATKRPRFRGGESVRR